MEKKPKKDGADTDGISSGLPNPKDSIAADIKNENGRNWQKKRDLPKIFIEAI